MNCYFTSGHTLSGQCDAFEMRFIVVVV